MTDCNTTLYRGIPKFLTFSLISEQSSSAKALHFSSSNFWFVKARTITSFIIVSTFVGINFSFAGGPCLLTCSFESVVVTFVVVVVEDEEEFEFEFVEEEDEEEEEEEEEEVEFEEDVDDDKDISEC